MPARQTIRLLALVIVAVLAALPAALADQHTGKDHGLPPEVKAFLERNQVQRWATMVAAGEKRFNEGSCARCHGEGGKEGRFGPDLTDGEWVQSDGDLMGIRDTIFWGVRKRDLADESRRFEMYPGGGMQIGHDEVDALAAYVWSLSRGGEKKQ